MGQETRHGIAVAALVLVALAGCLGVYEDGTDHVRYPDRVTADGARAPLDPSLSGEHTVRVFLHRDVDGNGEFDPAVDRPCYDDSGPTGTGPRTIEFSDFDAEE